MAESKLLFIRESTWKYVQEARPAEPDAEWIKRDEKAQSTISLSIDDSQIIHICKCETAKEMWDELQKVHERANLSNKLYLMRKLYQTKLSPDQDMTDYIRSTLEIVERLHGIGEEIRDFHIAALLLSGLPDSYESLVTALDARPDDELTLEYVKGKLVDEYKRRTESTRADKSESALKTYDKTKTKGNNKQLETRDCFFCKKPGHLKKDCRAWKAKVSELRKLGKYQKAKTAVNDDDSNSDVAFKVGAVSSAGWYIDSGATSHTTNDRNFFIDFRKTKNEKVTVANGQYMMPEGVGDGYLYCPVSDKNIRFLSKMFYMYQLWRLIYCQLRNLLSKVMSSSLRVTIAASQRVTKHMLKAELPVTYISSAVRELMLSNKSLIRIVFISGIDVLDTETLKQ